MERVFTTRVYGNVGTIVRRELWDDLIQRADNVDKPWIIGGDFNAVLSSNEVRGGRFNYPAADEFGDCVSLSGLIEITGVGNPLSWCNNRKHEERIYKKMDRVFVNSHWVTSTDSVMIYDTRVLSDHSPIVVRDRDLCQGRLTRFVFQNMWMQKESLRDLVRNHWNDTGHRFPLHNITAKLRSLKGVIREWNKNEFGDVKERWENSMKEIQMLETTLETAWDDNIWQTLQKAKNEFFDTELQKEIFYKQKAKEQWIEYGYRNMKYFHAVVKERRKGSDLLRLEQRLRAEGNFVCLLDVGKDYYQNLLTFEECTDESEFLMLYQTW